MPEVRVSVGSGAARSRYPHVGAEASGGDNPMKKRKIGIRFFSAGPSVGIPAEGNIELYDVETGEAIDGVSEIAVSYRVGDAIVADVKLYVQRVDAKTKE